MFPDVLDNTPPKYAISKRNTWMVNRSDIVVVYVKYSFGGAARFRDMAVSKGKTVINLAE